jgi:DNA segregation ATPase FtsK/SpoIIIE-like protein
MKSQDIEKRPKDEFYDQAKEIFLKEKVVSVCLLQRRLGTGYNRSCHIVEQMADEGFVRRKKPEDAHFYFYELA